MSTEKQPTFTGLRALLWPIRSWELKKLLPMGMLLFCMLFNYTTVRVLKDGFMVTSKAAGAVVLPFLKFYLVLPAAVLFVVLYAQISLKWSKSTVFYSIVGFFMAFFFLFGNVLFPMHEALHMSDSKIMELAATYPRLGPVIAMFGMWSFSLFYVLAELWGNVGITVLFWQFANQITTTEESKRYYISYQSIGNFALILAALLLEHLFPGEQVKNASGVQYAANVVVFFCFLAVGLYYYVNKYVMTDPKFPMPEKVAKKPKGPKPGLVQSFKTILTSKYLAYITLLLVGYGVAINLVEVTWKDMMGKYAKAEGISYVALQSKAFFYTGISAIVISTFGKSIVSRLGWKWTALVTPIGMLITGLIFFGCILAPGSMTALSSAVGLSTLGLGVLIGTAQNVFAKSTKYVLFDTTKEMAYIPLPETLKVEGKAAVEVFGGRAGKSAGGLTQMIIIMLVGTKDMFALTPALSVGLLVIVLLWIFAVHMLSKEYTKAIAEDN